MKKLILLILIICCVSCERKVFYDTFDKVVIYDYGRSPIGLTFDVPVKFFFNKKEIATFHLYSIFPDLENGVYKYNETAVNSIVFTETSTTSDKTFFKGRCKWGDNIITDGTVTVDKQGDNYTFIVEITDNTGTLHYGKFSGKVKKEDWHTKSNVNLFVTGTLTNEKGSMGAPVGTPSDFSGGISLLFLDAGDVNKQIYVSLEFSHNNENDPTGTYNINPNANGFFYPDINVYQNTLVINCRLPSYQLTSGTITITRVNKPTKFRIDVDVITENGWVIKGCYDGGKYFICDYD